MGQVKGLRKEGRMWSQLVSPVYPVKRVSGCKLPLDLELRTKMHLDMLNLRTLLPS